jgi:hypothetical protein
VNPIFKCVKSVVKICEVVLKMLFSVWDSCKRLLGQVGLGSRGTETGGEFLRWVQNWMRYIFTVDQLLLFSHVKPNVKLCESL